MPFLNGDTKMLSNLTPPVCVQNNGVQTPPEMLLDDLQGSFAVEIIRPVSLLYYYNELCMCAASWHPRAPLSRSLPWLNALCTF